ERNMDNKIQSNKVLCFGLIMVDILMNELEELPTHWEQTLLADKSFLNVGGGAANSARTFGRLGTSVDLLGHLGTDFFSEFVARKMESDGVSISKLVHDTNLSSGLAVGL